MKSRYWIIGWIITVVFMLTVIGVIVFKVDPYMHFHRPDTSKYYYVLDNERSQNDGITKYFDYDAIITGTSMTENFKTSEMDDLFCCESIKVPYSGGGYKEINDNVKKSIRYNSKLRIVVRGLDISSFYYLRDKDSMRNDMGVYPKYLYDSNPINDVKYIWNRDIIWNRVYKMMTENNQDGFETGITSFDCYAQWQYKCLFGINSVCLGNVLINEEGSPIHLSEEERDIIKYNIQQNVTEIAKDNPNITFYYFFTPYSAAWWAKKKQDGTIYKQVEAEKYISELILEYDNIKLFSINNRTDITCDFNNYRDESHYGIWINSLLLKWMHDGNYQLTKDNYKAYFNEELNNYLNMDYSLLNEQEDYENDFYAAALLNHELTGAMPLNLLEEREDLIHLNRANIVDNQYNDKKGIDCIGSLNRGTENELDVETYIMNCEYIGATINVDNVDKYRYICFWGKKIRDNGQPTVFVIDEKGRKIKELSENFLDIDFEWHQYVIDISDVKGNIKILFNGGYLDKNGSSESEYIFSNIHLF